MWRDGGGSHISLHRFYLLGVLHVRRLDLHALNYTDNRSQDGPDLLRNFRGRVRIQSWCFRAIVYDQ